MADAYSDYAELEIAHDNVQSENDISDIDSPDDALPAVLKTKTFRAKIKSSKSSKSAVRPFLAAVNIDLKRRTPIGLLKLFSAWLEFGN